MPNGAKASFGRHKSRWSAREAGHGRRVAMATMWQQRLGNLKEKALSTLENTLDAAEDRFLEQDDVDSARDDDVDPFADPRVVESLERLRREAAEEVELQREAFEARIGELEAGAERARSASAARADGGGAAADVVAVVAAAALAGAGAADADDAAAALAERPPSEAAAELRRLVADAARSTNESSPSDGELEATKKELATLRQRFEAAREAHSAETAQLRDVVASARSLAGQKATEAADEKKRAAASTESANAERERQDLVEKRLELAADRHRAAAAAGQAALRELDAWRRAARDLESRERQSRQRLDDARHRASDGTGAAKAAMERLAAVEADLRVAASDREQALQKHRNLEAVVRRFQAVADEDKAKAKKVHLDRVYELETELENARAANEDLVKEKDERAADLTKADLGAARAAAEARAARAAAAAAVCEVAKLKDALLHRPDPVPAAPDATNGAAKPTGFAALLNGFIDDELESG